MEQAPAPEVVENASLIAIDEIFGNGRTTLPLADGTVVQISKAKTKQVGAIIRVFSDLLATIPKEEFDGFLEKIAEQQRDLIEKGLSPFELGEGGGVLLTMALGHHSMILTALSALADTLPRFVEGFTSLSATQLEELDFEEFALVVAAVVGVNYSFFTQSLRPTLKTVIASWKSNGSGKKKKPTATLAVPASQ